MTVTAEAPSRLHWVYPPKIEAVVPLTRPDAALPRRRQCVASRPIRSSFSFRPSLLLADVRRTSRRRRRGYAFTTLPRSCGTPLPYRGPPPCSLFRLSFSGVCAKRSFSNKVRVPPLPFSRDLLESLLHAVVGVPLISWRFCGYAGRQRRGGVTRATLSPELCNLVTYRYRRRDNDRTDERARARTHARIARLRRTCRTLDALLAPCLFSRPKLSGRSPPLPSRMRGEEGRHLVAGP